MYGLFVLAMVIFTYGVVSRVRSWRRGAGSPSTLSWRARARQLLTHVIRQVIIWRSVAAGHSHAGIFWGFIALLVGTAIGRFPRLFVSAWLGEMLKLPTWVYVAIAVGGAVALIAWRVARGKPIFVDDMANAAQSAGSES